MKYFNWLENLNKEIGYNIYIKRNIFEINQKALNNIEYDIMLFIPNGCYKYLDMFVNMENFSKIMFLEIHADNNKRGNHVINNM